MKEVDFIKENKLVHDSILKTQDDIKKEKRRITGEKVVVFAGLLAITHGVLVGDGTSFAAGLFTEAGSITALLCSKKNLNNLKERERALIRQRHQNYYESTKKEK